MKAWAVSERGGYWSELVWADSRVAARKECLRSCGSGQELYLDIRAVRAPWADALEGADATTIARAKRKAGWPLTDQDDPKCWACGLHEWNSAWPRHYHIAESMLKRVGDEYLCGECRDKEST